MCSFLIVFPIMFSSVWPRNRHTVPIAFLALFLTVLLKSFIVLFAVMGVWERTTRSWRSTTKFSTLPSLTTTLYRSSNKPVVLYSSSSHVTSLPPHLPPPLPCPQTRPLPRQRRSRRAGWRSRMGRKRRRWRKRNVVTSVSASHRYAARALLRWS